jgi:hypothetical protein
MLLLGRQNFNPKRLNCWLSEIRTTGVIFATTQTLVLPAPQSIGIVFEWQK